MNTKLTVQYYPDFSRLNYLNPLTKLFLLICLSGYLLSSKMIELQLVVFFLLVILFIDANTNPFRIQGGKLVFLSSLLIAAFQIIFIKDGEVILEAGWISITSSGIENAGIYSMRFISIILLGFLFVLSTNPNGFVLSLMQVGFPYRYGYTLITAIRMLPIFKEEMRKITWAQLSRGADYSIIPFRKFFNQTIQFLTVLLVSMIKKVNCLVFSMEGRSFGLYNDRTFIQKISYGWWDVLLMIVGGSLTIFFFATKIIQ